MIIYGTRTLTGTKGQGTFHCPRCQMQRQYNHVEGRTWFTLYFIPLIPMWRAGEYVECPSCGASYGMEVLNYRPDQAAQEGDLLTDVRRTLVLTLLAAGRTGQADLDRLFQWWQQAGLAPLAPQALVEDLQLAHRAGAQLGPFVQSRLARLDADARLTLVRSARQVLAQSGKLGSQDEQALRSLAFALQLPPTTTDELIRAG
jgi:hypothetical protein